MLDTLTADIFLFIRTRVKIASILHQHSLPNSACTFTKDDALTKIDALLERIVRSSQLYGAIFTKSSIAETNRTPTSKRKQAKNWNLLKSVHIISAETSQITVCAKIKFLIMRRQSAYLANVALERIVLKILLLP